MGVLRWIVEGAALLITFFLFHRVCYEQYRFRKLVGDLGALVELNKFFKRNTTIPPEQGFTLLDKRALRRPSFGERLCDYLEQTIKRNIEIIDQLGEIRSGACSDRYKSDCQRADDPRLEAGAASC